MRRLKIIWFWLSRGRNNVGLAELLLFLLKPKVQAIAARYIKGIDASSNQNFSLVRFKNSNVVLYWPKRFSINGIFQVTAETYDPTDWHYYRKEMTPISAGEHLVDVGTAEGLLALDVAEKCASITLVEPNPYFVAALKASFEPHKHKTTIIESAIGEQKGETTFAPDSLTGSISGQSTEAVTVKVDTLDNLISADKPVTYLKADIEGFEEAMLLGAKRIISTNKPKIAITSYHGPNNPKRIIEIVKSYVPEYKHKEIGLYEMDGKTVMIHFWL
jgi:FkbM family methyltransferase